MLIIKVPAQKLYDEETAMFYDIGETTLHLEHSLLAISKWETKYQKPFLDAKTQKTIEEIMAYVECMSLDPEDAVDPRVWKAISRKDIKRIEDYISDKKTATTISNVKNRGGKQRRAQIITSELLYYYMSTLGIPFECETWHLSRLMMLIQVAAIEQQGPQKMPRNEMLSQRKALNRARNAKMGKH